MYNRNGAQKWQNNGKERQKKELDPVAQLIGELNDRSYVLTTKIKFLNYVHNNCRIKDANVALDAWNTLMTSTSTSPTSNGAQLNRNGTNGTLVHANSSHHSSRERLPQSLSSRITRPNQPPAANPSPIPSRPSPVIPKSMNLSNYPKVLPRKPKFPPKKWPQEMPKRDPMQFAREKIRHLQNKINFRANMQDAFAEAKDKGVKKLIEELLLFEKNVPYTEERFKNFLKHNMKVGDEELVHKMWMGIMFGFDEAKDVNKESGYHEEDEEDNSKHEPLQGDDGFYWDYYDAEYDSMDEILADLYDKDE